MTSNNEAKKAFDRQIASLERILKEAKFSSVNGRLEAWLPNAKRSLESLGLTREAKELFNLYERLQDDSSVTFTGEVQAVLDYVREIKAELDEEPSLPQVVPDAHLANFPITDAAKQVLWICERFSIFATQIAKRQLKRKPFNITDEFDVQDALHALLRMHFDDVRPEEWAPSHAGRASRIDFILKANRIAIEVKHTRDDLLDGEVGKELIIDIHRYKKHPDCGHLICFVYDPGHKLKNPAGLERDLSKQHDGLLVWVVVGPRRT